MVLNNWFSWTRQWIRYARRWRRRPGPWLLKSRLYFEGLENRLLPTTHTWTGLGADNHWTTANNWDDFMQPTANDVLIFAPGALQTVNLNDFPANTTFQSISVEGGYDLRGNSLQLGAGGLNSTAGIDLIENATSLPASTTLTVTVAAGSTLDLAGVIGGAGNLAKAESGQLILSAANAYTGQTQVTAGTVTLHNAAGLGVNTGQPASAVVVGIDGTVAVEGGLSVGNKLLNLGNGNLRSVSGANSWAGQIAVSTVDDVIVDPNSRLTLSGQVQGGALNKLGTGKLILTAGNTYTGGTRVFAGILNIQNGAALGAASAGTVVDSGATLEVQGGITVNQPLTLSGFGFGSDFALTSVDGNNTWQGMVNLASSNAVSVAAGSVLTIGGTVTSGSNVVWSTFGPGTLVLAGSNTYRGTTQVITGVLDMESLSALGNGNNATVVSQGTLRAGFHTALFGVVYALSLNGAGAAGAGALQIEDTLEWDGTITLNTSATIRVDGPGSLDMHGQISGGPAAALTKTGTGDMLLRVASSYQGPTVVSQGTLYLENGGALGTGPSGVTVAGGATLELNGGITVNQKPLSLAGNGINGVGALRNLSGPNVWTGIVKLTANATVKEVEGTITFNEGVIGPTGVAITEAGTGALVLRGITTTITPIVINGGVVAVDGGTHSPVTVNAGGVLTGTGDVGAITVNSGGTLSPGGANPGTLAAFGDVLFNPGSNFQIRINGVNPGTQYDQLVIGGADQNVTISNANLIANLLFQFAPAGGTPFTLIDNTTNGTTSGTFRFNNQPLTQGGSFTLNGLAFRMNYSGGDFNDVVITRNNPTAAEDLAIEPATINQGDSVTLTGHLTDADVGDVLTLVVDWGDGEVNTYSDLGTDPFALPHQYAATGSYIVHATWFDDHGEGNDRYLTDYPVTVNDVPPAVDGLTVTSPVNVGDTATLRGTVVNPAQNPFTMQIDWGDGTREKTREYGPSKATFHKQHTYRQAGTFTISVTLYDAAESTTDTIDVVVQDGSAPAGANRRGRASGLEAALSPTHLAPAAVVVGWSGRGIGASPEIVRTDRTGDLSDRGRGEAEARVAPTDLRVSAPTARRVGLWLGDLVESRGRTALDDLFASGLL